MITENPAQVDNGFWRGRSVAVTGATGFVGSWLVRKLVEAGAEVVCLIRESSEHPELLRTVESEINIVTGDVRDQAVLEQMIREHDVRTFFHLAAQTIVGAAFKDPTTTFDSNIKGTWSLLEACRRNPIVEQIIIASSDKAYGSHDRLPFDEQTPLQGQNPYEVSKSCADLISTAYAKTYALPIAITRCGNFYGGGDLNWNRIVPGTIRSVLTGQRPMIRSDGSSIRDYFYVEDGTAAYMLLAQQLAARPDELRGQAFNFSNQLKVSVKELVHRILAKIGSDLEPQIVNSVNGVGNESRYQYLSAAKAQRMLNWAPSFSLDEGLERTIAWYRELFANSVGDPVAGRA